jgi:squalene-hopene/tetraprenyl-beta-curcumene cyclase
MAIREALALLVVPGMLAFVAAMPGCGGENTTGQLDMAAARQFLDSRGAEWFKFGSARRGEGASSTSCVSCHSLLSFALARPVLRRATGEKQPTELETKILAQVKTRVANWDALDTAPFQLMYDFDEPKKKQSRGTESVINALVLSLDDRFRDLKTPSADAKKALSILWKTQVTEGEHNGSWEWLDFRLQPWEGEGGRFLGASMAAIAVGTARESGYAMADADSQAQLQALRDYLIKNDPSQNLHNRAWMLWASAKLDGLLTHAQTDDLKAQLFAKQQPDGGFSLGGLGKFSRKDVRDESKTSDGYATGLVLHALQIAGVAKEEAHVEKGLAWLRTHQDRSGAWRAASVNKNRAPESFDKGKAHVGKFMWDAATAYAVLALSH